MRLLILFAAWAKDDTENTHRWINWYREIFDREFPNDDKFLAINYDSSGAVDNRFRDLPKLIGIERVSEEMHVNSDAAAYQLALIRCAPIFENYDYIFFMHTKGASYEFSRFDAWRTSVSKSIFSRKSVSEISKTGKFVIAERGHLIQNKSSIEKCRALAKRLGIYSSVFHYAAGTTLYYAPGQHVSALVSKLPYEYMNRNLIHVGESRFFFEANIPSLLTMLGAVPTFIGGSRLNPLLHPEMSYDCDPLHNSYLVERLFAHRRTEGGSFAQVPVPYVSGKLAEVSGLQVQFAS